MKKVLKIAGIVLCIVSLVLAVFILKKYSELNRDKESVQKLVSALYKNPTIEGWESSYMPEVFNGFQLNKENFEAYVKVQNEVYGEFKTISDIKIDTISYYYKFLMDKEKRDAAKGYVVIFYTGTLIFDKKEKKVFITLVKKENDSDWKVAYVDSFPYSR